MPTGGKARGTGSVKGLASSGMGLGFRVLRNFCKARSPFRGVDYNLYTICGQAVQSEAATTIFIIQTLYVGPQSVVRKLQ